MVHYVLPATSARKGEVRPAFIVRIYNPIEVKVNPGMSNLSVVLDTPNDSGEIVWRGSVLYDRNGGYGTWHWPK